MSDEVKEKLKAKVFDFIQKQEGYNQQKHERLKVFCEDKDTWAIVYGENMQEGIAGYGETSEDAFSDFVENWKKFKGFEWFE